MRKGDADARQLWKALSHTMIDVARRPASFERSPYTVKSDSGIAGGNGTTLRHKVFVSYHHANDQDYRDMFERMCEGVMESRSVDIGDIDPNLNTETVRQRIRDEYLRDASVTVVLIGAQTWQRKHVDWEIGSSIRDTKMNPRSGLLGIILPTHPDHGTERFTPGIVPPRLYDNFVCGYAKIYAWLTDPAQIQSAIHEAFTTKDVKDPDNSRPLFSNNRSGPSWQ